MSNKYRYMVYSCFPGLDIDTLDKTMCISLKYEERFPMLLHFRETIRKHLKDKGYSKKQIENFMDMYTSIYAVGFMTGAAVRGLVDDEAKKELFDF